MTPDLYERHKPVRNRIRKLEPTSLISQAINKLAVCDRNPRESTYMPWELLLLIKWTFLYSQEPSHLAKEATEVDLNRCLNDIRNLYSDIKLPSQEDSNGTGLLNKFVRRISFQQFSFQMELYELKHVISMQLILFADLGEEYKMGRRFQCMTSFEIVDFILLCFGTWMLLNVNKNSRLTVRNFSEYASPSDTERFLEKLSLDLHSGKQSIKEDIETKKKAFEVQLYELTPLVMYPLFNNGNYFTCYSKKLFNITFSKYIHNLLKAHDATFTEDFGNIFEKYIEKGLKYLDCDYLNERQIKELLPKQSRRIDFILPYEDCTVLVEVKSAEMHPVAKVFQSRDSLTRNLRTSIIKAVLQIYEVASHLQTSSASSKIHNIDQVYGIVITYQDYYLGPSAKVWKEFIGNHVELELDKKGIPSELIPYENLYYISAKEFDYLIGGLKKLEGLSLSDVLEKVRENNASASTEKWTFLQHLVEIFGRKYYIPNYLEERFKKMGVEATNRLKR